MKLRIISYGKMCSRLSDTVLHKLDFTTNDLHSDQPPAWVLIWKSRKKTLEEMPKTALKEGHS